jgi:hypothetical protein
MCKKLITLAAFTIMVFAFGACSDEDNQPQYKPEITLSDIVYSCMGKTQNQINDFFNSKGFSATDSSAYSDEQRNIMSYSYKNANSPFAFGVSIDRNSDTVATITCNVSPLQKNQTQEILYYWATESYSFINTIEHFYPYEYSSSAQLNDDYFPDMNKYYSALRMSSNINFACQNYNIAIGDCSLVISYEYSVIDNNLATIQFYISDLAITNAVL